MNDELTTTYLDFAQSHTEPLLSVDRLLDIHRKFRNRCQDPRHQWRSCLFLSAVVHTITASLDSDDPHRHPQLADDSDPDSDVLTSQELISGEPDAVEIALSAFRFAIHRRRAFEGHHDPGLLVIFYHVAYMIGAGSFDADSIANLLNDVAVPPGTYTRFAA